ncbi:MAG: aminotransferase class I/II-fold pyridoxal phosphate-dependent enzyme [Leucobacter sp.]
MANRTGDRGAAREISGSTAEEIAASVRALIAEGELNAGDSLPPYRALAEALGVNRNTAMTAYRLLVQASIAESRGRAGTVVADPHPEYEEEGFAHDTVLRDAGDGNPDPAFLPDPTRARLDPATPVLYGEPPVDSGLAEWGTRWIEQDQPRPFRLTVTAGAVDAVERLLAQALTRGDAVALEDPCFLTSISTIRQNGYRAVPVEMDAEGMLPESLRAALEAGARAVVCTPRAHNPTGASLTGQRAKALRTVLADYPQVLVLEDDHFSFLASAPYATIIGDDRRRWALVRSMSKALGPDTRIALVASDTETAERLAARISGGITWVSHFLQRTAHAMLTDPETMAQIRAAGEHYADRNAAFVEHLRSVGLDSASWDGLSVWVDTGSASAEVLTRLMRRGWIAREGSAFALAGDHQHHHRHLRLTVHRLTDAEMRRLATDLAEASLDASALGPRSRNRRAH